MSVINSRSPATFLAASYTTPTSAPGTTSLPAAAQTPAGTVAVLSPAEKQAQDAKNAVQKSLNQTLNAFMQKLRVDLSKPPKQSSQVDAMQKAMLKQRVDALRQMMQLAGRDKASLKALAAELARVSQELKQLVSSMSDNAAAMSLDPVVGGGAAVPATRQDASGSVAATADAAVAGADPAAQAGAASAGSVAPSAADTASGADALGQAATATTGGNAEAAPSAADANDGARLAVQQAPSTLSAVLNGKGNPVAQDPDIQLMLQTLKAIRDWIKQQAQALKSDSAFKDSIKTIDKALTDVDKILAGGQASDAGIDVQIEVHADVGANVDVKA